MNAAPPNAAQPNAALPSVLVVVVNYRTGRLVVDCLRSLAPEVLAHPGTAVLVVDNASGDDSVEVISAAIAGSGWASWASLLPSPTNGGFAAGNNLAIRAALASPTPPECFWMLNPDTVVRPGALRALADFMAKNPQVGILGGGIDEADGSPWSVMFRFPGILSEIERGLAFGPVTRLLSRWNVLRPAGPEPARVDWVSGATFMVRRTTVETIGLMDDRYFLYFEETDYCRRAQRAGIECWYQPQSRIMHIAGQSTGLTAKSDQPRRVPAYWFESRRRYFAKSHGRLYAALADLAWMSAFCLGRLRNWLQRKPAALPPRLLADFFRHSSLWNSPDAALARGTGPDPSQSPNKAANSLPSQ